MNWRLKNEIFATAFLKQEETCTSHVETLTISLNLWLGNLQLNLALDHKSKTFYGQPVHNLKDSPRQAVGCKDQMINFLQLMKELR